MELTIAEIAWELVRDLDRVTAFQAYADPEHEGFTRVILKTTDTPGEGRTTLIHKSIATGLHDPFNAVGAALKLK